MTEESHGTLSGRRRRRGFRSQPTPERSTTHVQISAKEETIPVYKLASALALTPDRKRTTSELWLRRLRRKNPRNRQDDSTSSYKESGIFGNVYLRSLSGAGCCSYGRFLVWIAFSGFLLSVFLRRSSIVELEKVRTLLCSRRRLWQVLVLSLPLNVFASLLVAASFARQILMSPTRQQVDRAHSKGNRLAVARPMTRNLRSVGFFKAVIWTALTISSFPFHFL
jgi:hypothetical protein